MNRTASRSALLAVAVAVALGGCDKLFDLEEIPARGDGGSDGVIDGVAVDAFVCQPVNHDEDTDTVDDACDLCPTFGGESDAGDSDGDGLPDECDRNNAPSGADRILAYWTFPTSAIAGFVSTGVLTYSELNNGSWTIGSDSTMAAVESFALTRVDFHVSGVTLASTSSELRLQVGGNTLCAISGGNCSGSNTGTCVKIGTSTLSHWPMPGSAARRISLYRSGSNIHCEISDGVNNVEAAAPAALFPGGPGVALNATASMKLDALVIYGEK